MKKILILITIILFGCTTVPEKTQFSYKDGIDNLSVELTETTDISNIIKLAVLPTIGEKGEKTELGYSIADDLQVKLFKNKNFQLIERERIDSILEEHMFSRSGLVDDNYIKKIGKMLSADSILTGTIRDFSDHYEIYNKIIDVETGNIQAIASTSLEKTEEIERKYKKRVIYNSSISGAYELSINKVILNNKNKDGNLIDSFSNPDFCYTLYISNEKIKESKVYDSFPIIELNEKIDVILKDDSIIEFRFYDSDFLGYELLDKMFFTPEDIKTILIEEKTVKTSDIIKEFVFTLKKIES